MLTHLLSQDMFMHMQSALPQEADAAHDASHSLRVAKNALEIAQTEGGDPEILVAAALLHDICNLKKSDPKAHLSAQLSCEQSKKILKQVTFPENKIPFVLDAIACHSFSAGLTPKTHEGKVFQDADRLDGLGAIGIARLFATSATFNSKFYAHEDPFLTRGRTPNDKLYAVDHFFVKLFKIPEKMQTQTGIDMAKKRIMLMKEFLKHLQTEVE